MNKTTVLMRASFLQLRLYLWIIIGIVAVSAFTNFIVDLSIGASDNTQVSAANLLLLFLFFAGSVLPASFFKRVVNLGATRKEYFVGVSLVYVLAAAFFALFNIAWFELEVGVIRDYEATFNILEIFHWNQFGIAGMFVYQFGAYMLLLTLLHLLFSGLRHIAGWVIWALLVAAIPIFTSIASLRHHLANGLKELLFNDSLLQGFGLAIIIACLLLAGSWWFTARRTLA